jgi:tetratricopeptide (TPR) repeat protein
MTSLRLLIARIRSRGAVLDLGRRLAARGDRAGAEEAFELVASSRDARHNLPGALHLWFLRVETGDVRAADEAYLRAVAVNARSGVKDSVAERSLTLGVDIAAYWREHLAPARRAYRRRIALGDAPLAAMGLAGLEIQAAETGHDDVDTDAITSLLRSVIDSGHREHVPAAAHWLAFLSDQTGDVGAARVAMSAAIDAGDRENACHVALTAGLLFEREGHGTEAITALRFVVDNNRTGLAVIAAQHLGELLATRGDVDGALAAYRYVLDKSTFPHVLEHVRTEIGKLTR